MANIAKVQYNAHRLSKTPFKYVGKAICRLLRVIYHCEIPASAKIDPSVRFSHKAHGVVIGHDAIIEKNCKILHNVTIGGREGLVGKDGRTNPHIQQNVLIGVGACILGPIEIGANSKIGANAVVIQNIPENAVVVVVPARVVKYVK
jgi:serine O-acetyltransferase